MSSYERGLYVAHDGSHRPPTEEQLTDFVINLAVSGEDDNSIRERIHQLLREDDPAVLANTQLLDALRILDA